MAQANHDTSIPACGEQVLMPATARGQGLSLDEIEVFINRALVR